MLYCLRIVYIAKKERKKEPSAEDTGFSVERHDQNMFFTLEHFIIELMKMR